MSLHWPDPWLPPINLWNVPRQGDGPRRNPVMTDFQREERYIVVKLKELTLFQQEQLRDQLADEGIDTVECVVVESDWPMYETTWDAIQRHVEGRPQKVDEMQALLEDAQATAADCQAKLDAIGRLNPVDYSDKEALLSALFKILRGENAS